MAINSRIKLILNSIVPPLLLIIGFAIFVFYRFGGSVPPGLNHDAAWHGLFALRILQGMPFAIYTPEAYGHETPYYYVMAAVFALIGSSKESIELTATLFGWISVGLFYWIINKKTHNAWLALGLSLLWISSSALVLFSRVGWQLITLVPASLWVAGSVRFYLDESDRSRFWALMLGISCGITLYTYNGGRSILLFLPLFWLVRLLQTRFERKACLDAALSLGICAFVCAPMLIYAAGNWQMWNGRAATLIRESDGLAGKWPNVVAGFEYFNVSAKGDDFFTSIPVLEGPMTLLWIAGLGFALLRFRVYWAEILLFLLFILPGIVTKPSFHRSIGTLPVVYLLAVYFLIALGRAMLRWLPKKKISSRTLATVFVAVIAFQLYSGWKKLYVDQSPFGQGFYHQATVVGRYMGEHPDQRFIVYATNWPKDILSFLSMTRTKKPEPNYANYQRYEFAPSDGLTELMRDLRRGTIKRPAYFLVDPNKAYKFSQAIEPIYRVRQDNVIVENESTAAFVYYVE